MSNPMKYIRDLEAAGFERTQAEAQVQVVLDALQGDLVTKAEFALFQERIENRFTQFQHSIIAIIDGRFTQHEGRFSLIDNRFSAIDKRFDEVDKRFDHVDKRFTEIDNRFSEVHKQFARVDKRFTEVDNRFTKIELKILESEFRLVTRLGFVMVSVTTLAVAVLTWLIKV